MVKSLIEHLPNGHKNTDFSTRFEADGISFMEPTEHLFDFNNPLGACPRCNGFGNVIGIDPDLVVPDKSKAFTKRLLHAGMEKKCRYGKTNW